MQDVVYLAVTVAFFVLSALFVVLCDRIIGPDDVAIPENVIANADMKSEIS